jgi:hypothetical protein
MSHKTYEINSLGKDLLYSSVATVVAEISTLPACTIKSVYQNSGSNSITQVTKEIYNKNGLKGFYNASYPAILAQTYSTSSKYVIYRYLENNHDSDHKKESSSALKKMMNGLISGVLTSIITHPMDILKIRMQINPISLSLFNNLTYQIKNIKTFKEYYKGYTATLGKVAIASSLFFPCKELYYDKLKRYEYFTPMQLSFLSSTGAAFTATIANHPVDYLKTTIIGTNSMKAEKLKEFQELVKVYGKYNPLLYYRGLSIHLLRVVPHFIITMSLIDYLNQKNM